MAQFGTHVGQDDPIGTATSLGINLAQIFLGDPQGWKNPVFPDENGAAGLAAKAQEAGVDLIVHARYVINVASTNNRVRIPSRKMLQADVDAAALIGAKAVVVHGGHVSADDNPEVGVANWVKALEQLDMRVPVLIENTAGGSAAMARRLDAIDRLWSAVGHTGVGFCLDTCHAHAGGLAMGDVAETILGITGRIDLVHCNDSRDSFDSGADRHTNLGNGNIKLDDILHCLDVANAPIILETPHENIAGDLEILRNRISG
jgi:deoxyribonuclease-4